MEADKLRLMLTPTKVKPLVVRPPTSPAVAEAALGSVGDLALERARMWGEQARQTALIAHEFQDRSSTAAAAAVLSFHAQELLASSKRLLEKWEPDAETRRVIAGAQAALSVLGRHSPT